MRHHLDKDQLRLTPEHLGEIRASVDWQSLFAGLGLKKNEAKSKAQDWWAHSPFHEEKTASFHMGPGGIWFDFSIGEGGGAIELIQKLHDCNCFEAGRFLLERGWATASIDHSPTQSQRVRTKRKVSEAVEPTAEQETKTSDKSEALTNDPIRQDLIPLCVEHELIRERGIGEETCALLGIGYLPQGRSPLKGRIVFQVADARQTKKSGEQKSRVILSHIGRAVKESQDPKYLFYEGFHKSAELYGQELIWLHEDAAEQAKTSGFLLLTEGPFDVAKAVEAGLRNVIGSFGSALSKHQALKLKAMADHFGITKVIIAYDRDMAGKAGADKALALLASIGLEPSLFDWDAPLGRTNGGIVTIPETISDLCDFTTEQMAWLRDHGRL